MKTVDELRLDTPPVWVGEAAAYPWSTTLARRLTVLDRYKEDEIELWRRDGDKILVARCLAPPGGEDRRQDGVPIDFRPEGVYRSVAPRDEEQERVILEASNLLDDGESFIIQAPTGFGKTVVAAELIADVGRKALVIVPNESLFTEWETELKEHLGLQDHEIGHIQGDIFRVDGCKVVLGSLKSLGIPGRYPAAPLRQFGLVVWDEVHTANAPTFGTTGLLVPARLRLGFSATPHRSDGKELLMFANIGPVRVVAQDRMLPFTVGLYLSPWQCPTRTKEIDGVEVEVPIPHSATECGHIINMIARHYGHNRLCSERTVAAYNAGRHPIVFSDRIEHLEVLRGLCIKAGVPDHDTGIYKSGLSKSRRLEVRGRRIIFATYGMCRLGFNVPRLDTLVFGTPRADVQQIVGRIRRFKEGKPRPVVIDPQHPSSPVLASWAKSRRAWYRSIEGANVVKY